ncbi:hypothetical protein [Burkholderia gladioli]|uniref:hypothetical protein n=1 Tax=Burkholderia gladioli TaxID=28095 RepID=UPI000B2102FB|nr:hypothetical protein [Burkholderia gladioli]
MSSVADRRRADLRFSVANHRQNAQSGPAGAGVAAASHFDAGFVLSADFTL